MKFRYEAKTKEGEAQVGYVEAGTRDAAVSILTGHGLFILKIETAETQHWFDRLGSYFSAVGSKDMVIFTRQLSTLLEARLPLSKALTTLHRQTVNPTLKEAIYQITQDVESGLSLSQALERQGTIFSDFFVSMIRSAEVTGNLDRVVGFLADYTEREAVIKSKAQSALIYPAVIILLFGVVVMILLTVVFPQLKPIFEQSNVQLPIMTRILLGSGEFIAKWWPGLIVVFMILMGMALDYLRTPEGRAFKDDLKVRLPLVSRIFLPLTITRFADASTMLMRGGVPVAQAMQIVGQTVDNVLYRDILQDVSQDIREGVTLSESIAKHPDYFPALVSQMVAVGEQTGQLDQILERVSHFYNREADTVINNLVDLIQPVLMIVIGVMIGLLFASVLLPLYKLTASLGG